MVATTSLGDDFAHLRQRISEEDIAEVLSCFGINKDHDEGGPPRWSVTVTSKTTDSPERKAYFDSTYQTWKFEDLSLLDVAEEAAADKSNKAASGLPTPLPGSYRIQRDGGYRSGHLETDSWIDYLPKTDHVSFFKNVDWASLLLGPVSTWPMSLRLYTNLVLSDVRPGVVYWGTDKAAIYNEALLPNIGQAHPSYMGKSFDEYFPEIAHPFDMMIQQMKDTGIGITLDETPYFLNRNGFVEETYWQGQLIPLRNDDGIIEGSYSTWHEVTQQVIGDRRSKLMDDIGHFSTPETESAWEHIQRVLGQYPFDVPMAMLYSADTTSDLEQYKLTLRGSIGVVAGHTAVPSVLDLSKDNTGFGPMLRQAHQSRSMWTVLDPLDREFPTETLNDIDWQGYKEKSKKIVIISLSAVHHHLKGFVILGLNPRRPFNVSHQAFIANLSQQLSTLFARITTLEQARKRGDQLMQELQDTEKRVRKISQMAPMGMYDVLPDGQLSYANDYFFDLLGIPDMRSEPARFSFRNVVHPDDLEAFYDAQTRCRTQMREVSGTIRLQRTWNPPTTGDERETKVEPAWMLYRSLPHMEHGQLKSLIGCLTDITQLKWAESVQAQRAEEAKWEKKRKEDFIDITSHEMRNPLSAITQCADSISTSLEEAETEGITGNPKALLAMLKSNVEAADSILLCAAHQRRIIDDVLTLSKLDSALLTITATPFRPHSIVAETVLMFNAEFASSDISVENHNEMGPDMTVFGDPSRILQILINLLTNAIKFTRTAETRRITIRAGTSTSPPPETSFSPDFHYCPLGQERRDLTNDAEYGHGEVVYLSFAVQDTGQGIAAHKAANVFDKFIQASKRTHIKYGGSGLGLFISRELTEMQGGLIGVGSQMGVGSTFAFYVKAKRAALLSIPMITGSCGYPGRRASRDETAIAAHSAGIGDHAMLGKAGSTVPVKSTRRNYNILLVEDNLVNQKVLAKQLRKAGCNVAVANHGGEAIDVLLRAYGHPSEYLGTDAPSSPFSSGGSSTPVLGRSPSSDPVHMPTDFDCVLMDWEMPVVDGLTATKRIRQLEMEGSIRERQTVLGVTANARLEQIKLAKDAGMDDVMPKPFRVPELMAKIKELLLKKEQRDSGVAFIQC